MTSTPDADHPDTSEISELVEGLLPPSRTVDLRGHLIICTPCSSVHTSLAEIRTLLGILPGPQVMPTDVAGRIDAALAAEAALTAVPPVAPRSVSRETERGAKAGDAGDPLDSRRGPRQVPTAEPQPGVMHRPSGRPREATGPGRRPTRRRRRTAILAASLGAAVIGVSVFLLQSVQPSQDATSKMADSGTGVRESSEQNFSEDTLERRVDALLSNTAAKESQSGGARNSAAKEHANDTKVSPDASSPDVAAPRNTLRTPAVPVPACVLQGTGRQTTALGVEEGRYRGTDAFLVVLPHVIDADRVQAYVIDATCVDDTPAAKGRLLLTHAYTRR